MHRLFLKQEPPQMTQNTTQYPQDTVVSPVSAADALPDSAVALTISPRHTVTGHDVNHVPDGFDTAYFAMGCFWGVERLFWQRRVCTAPPPVTPVVRQRTRLMKASAPATPVMLKPSALCMTRPLSAMPICCVCSGKTTTRTGHETGRRYRLTIPFCYIYPV